MTAPPDPSVLADITALHELMFPAAGQCIRVAAELRLATLLADKPRSVAELSAQTSTVAPALHTVLRVLADEDIFAEVAPGVFANTRRSVLLSPDMPHSQYTMAQFAGAEWLWSCYSSLNHSVATGAAAFDRIFRTNLWAWMARQPERARQFNDAMNEFSTTVGPIIAQSYAEFGRASVVADLGGGQGSFLASILSAYPTVGRGVLVDLPAVIEQARTREELDLLVGHDRLEFFAGDFFDDVPAHVDLYVTKQIMHSWNDERLVTLLKRCRDASPTANIAAVELVQRPGMTRFVKNFDVIMLVTMAGAIRSTEDFAAVFDQAGYALRRVVSTGTAFSIIEAVPTG
ncbi:MAG TPA: methyltransferase [Mycobacteriales bacterium]|nr:methyltransferase [Mycobacteriales bacterium]